MASLKAKNSGLGKFSWSLLSIILIFSLAVVSSCKKDDPEPPEVIASFQFAIDDTDFLEVAFTNYSEHATSYSWDFGDMDTSTEENPVHTYAAAGTYVVKLVATGDGGTAEITREVNIVDPLAAQRALIGDNGKEWQLIADVSTGVYPYMIVPAARNDIWWAFGGQHDYDPLCVRYTIFDDVWTFNTDGTFDFENNGDFWAEGGVWPDAMVGNFDATVAGNWTGKDGQDLSGWDSGTNNFVYDPTAQTLTVTGGFVGLSKVGTTGEVTEPQATVVYKVTKLVDADNGVDTLVLETSVVDAASGETTAYWISTLVSYDSPNDVIVIDECPAVEKVNVTFKLNFNGYTGTATVPEVNGTFNNWCGNCNAMTDDNGDGIWEVTLELAPGEYEYKFSADNWADQEALTDGSTCTITTGTTVNRALTVGNNDMTVGPYCWNSCENCPVDITSADLEGDWTLAPVAQAMGVGPGSGNISWWSSSLDDATTTRACLFDDVYTFVDDGTFTYDQGGSTFVETWQGAAADGCDTPVAPHDGSGTYTWEVTTPNIVKVIGQGAFLAHAKAYNGGELSVGATAPDDITYTITEFTVAGDGTRNMTIEVDISANSGWNRILDLQDDISTNDKIDS